MVTEKMIEALQPLADAVFNDNGDITVQIPTITSEDCIKAYFAVRRAEAALSTDAEPVAIYKGNGLIDCGDGGHHNIELLKLIPANTPLYAAPTAPSVAVNALEWHDRLKTGEREGFVCSSSGVLSYSIMLSRFRVYGISGPHDGAMEYSSLEEAKAAAQADYEARIRSALSAQVQDVAEHERHADYLEAMADVIMDSEKAGKLEAKLTMERAAKFIRTMLPAAPAAKLEEKP